MDEEFADYVNNLLKVKGILPKPLSSAHIRHKAQTTSARTDTQLATA